MTKHYILRLDPNAHYEWDRCTLRDPITAEHPALADLVANAIGEESGSYLVSVHVEVNVLESAAIAPVNPSLSVAEAPNRSTVPHFAELVA